MRLNCFCVEFWESEKTGLSLRPSVAKVMTSNFAPSFSIWFDLSSNSLNESCAKLVAVIKETSAVKTNVETTDVIVEFSGLFLARIDCAAIVSPIKKLNSLLYRV